jgi:hypothetical protein
MPWHQDMEKVLYKFVANMWWFQRLLSIGAYPTLVAKECGRFFGMALYIFKDIIGRTK